MKDVVLTHLALPFLTLVLCVVVRQQVFVLPRLRKELRDLNKRRANRVQAALAGSTAAAWMEPAVAPNHPFAAWVALNDDGTLSIGGETLLPSKPFHVTARDSLHLSRAIAICQGDGKVLISSQGQVFLVRFANSGWNVSPASISS